MENLTPFEKIKKFFENKQATEQYVKVEKENEAGAAKASPLSYTISFIDKTDNILAVSELKEILDESESEYKLQISATESSRYISEFASRNYSTALHNLTEINEARKLLKDAVQQHSVNYFQKDLEQKLKQYDTDVKKQKVGTLYIQPTETGAAE